MNASKIKLSIATAALLAAGSVLAQGTPPNPNVSNPALGAGQQTQQGTSMGTTGVPSAAPGTLQQAPATAPGTAMTPPTPAAPPSSTMDAPMRPARADRN